MSAALSIEYLQARIAELEAENAMLRKAADKNAPYELVKSEDMARFWPRVQKTDTCWLWTAGERFHLTKRIALSPRRVSWRMHIGPLPEGEIGMCCRVKNCVNPEHMAQTDAQKFWALVKKADGDGCWEWQGGLVKKHKNGERTYGAFAPRTGELYPAHRYAYELTYGKIEGHVGHDYEKEICVCHACDNPRCVRPDHLWLGSDQDNHDDMVRKGRHAHGPEFAARIRATRNMKRAAESAMGFKASETGGEGT